MNLGLVLLRSFQALRNPGVLLVHLAGAALDMAAALVLTAAVAAAGYFPLARVLEVVIAGGPMPFDDISVRGGSAAILAGAVGVLLVGSLTRGASLHAVGMSQTGRVRLATTYRFALRAWPLLLIPGLLAAAPTVLSIALRRLNTSGGSPLMSIALVAVVIMMIAGALWSEVGFCHIAAGSDPGTLDHRAVSGLVLARVLPLIGVSILLGLVSGVVVLLSFALVAALTTLVSGPAARLGVSVPVEILSTALASTVFDGGIVSLYRQFVGMEGEDQLSEMSFESDGVPVGTDGLPHPELTGMPAPGDPDA